MVQKVAPFTVKLLRKRWFPPFSTSLFQAFRSHGDSAARCEEKKKTNEGGRAVGSTNRTPGTGYFSTNSQRNASCTGYKKTSFGEQVMVILACVAGVKRGRGKGNLGTRERVGRLVLRPNTLPFPFRTPATQANGYTRKIFHLRIGSHFTIMYRENNRENSQSKLVIQGNNHHINLSQLQVREGNQCIPYP